MDQKKQKFINELKANGGIIYVSCANTGISRQTYYRWKETDEEFAEMVAEVMEAQIDHVESRLMELINSGDTSATIFYLKTKGRGRGWSDKPQPSGPPDTVEPAATLQPPSAGASEDVKARIRNKKTYIVKLLKKEGKYTSELSMQVDIVAQLLVRTDMLRDEVIAPGYSPVNVEVSREGNTRESVSAKERLYLDLLQQSQRALRALGMNTDSRDRKQVADGFDDFLSQFREDGK